MTNITKTGIILLVILVLAGGWFIIKTNKPTTKVTTTSNIHDGAYKINGQSIMLVNGLSEIEAAPGSASKITTRYFGNEVKHDFNDDGTLDSAFLITQETGGTGIFYYVVARLNTPNGPIGSQALFLGDRIAPQSTNMEEGTTSNGTNRKNVIVVNYADRKAGEAFTVSPSVGKSIWIKLDPKTMQFGEVAQNFEGETR